MYEFDSVSVSSYEASSLAAKLTERSNDGWEIVSIVAAGSDVVAFLKKAGAGAGATTATDASGTEAASTDESAATEPAGWGTAPAAAATTSGWGDTTSTPSDKAAAAGATGATWGGSGGDSGATWGGSSGGSSDSGWGSTAAAATPSTPSVPPGWYADPAGRYELRYWDGSAWTEHVSRAGQQYTDPPVA